MLYSFDELVSRARIQDEIYKDIAVEKAKGLVAMLMQRRKYIKLLRKSKNPSSNNNNRAKNWIPPSSPIAKSTDSSGPFIQLRRSMMVNSPLKRNNNPRGIKSEENISTKTEGKLFVCLYRFFLPSCPDFNQYSPKYCHRETLTGRRSTSRISRKGNTRKIYSLY
jgi:hypothetical protein